MYKAIRKHRPENFTIESIYESTDKDYTLNVMEAYFIKEYASNNPKIGYNMTSGGEGLTNLSKSSRKKISESLTGRKLSEETKEKISITEKGRIPWNKGLTKKDPRISQYISTRNKNKKII